MDINATLIGQSVSFLIFILICYKFIWPHLLGAIEERQKYIADSLSAAAHAKEEAVKTGLDNKKVLDKAKLEAREILDKAKARADQIVESSKIEAINIKKEIEEQGRQQLAIEIAKAKLELRKEVSELAILAAEKVLSKEINKSTNGELINQFLNKLEQSNNG